eukprot:5957386-Prymnesium_polylepis.1
MPSGREYAPEKRTSTRFTPSSRERGRPRASSNAVSRRPRRPLGSRLRRCDRGGMATVGGLC